MINITDEKTCCGCKNCINACPNNCIRPVERELGHIFPSVDAAQCVGCGKCEAVCPMLSGVDEAQVQQKLFAAYSRDPDIRRSGSSGGMFGVFAKHLIALGYCVYAAAFDKDMRLVTTLAESEEELKPLCKSKYLICDTVDSFDRIRERLQNGGKVFYLSSPCQVAALKKYLGKDYEGLLTVDFFCHGVPSARFFRECLEFDAKKRYRGKKIIGYRFREKKRNGSTPHYFSVLLEDNSRRFGYYFDSTAYAAFQKYICLRESCYSCKFAGRNRPSDLTVGDLYEIERYVKGIDRYDGVSKIVVNSAAGKELLDACRESLICYELDLDRLIGEKLIFAGNTERPAETDRFIEEYEKNGVEGVYRKYLKSSFYLKNRLYYSLPVGVRKAIKKAKGMF